MADELKPEGSPEPASKAPEEAKAAPPKPIAAKPAAPKAPPPPKPPAVMMSTPWEGDLPARVKETFGDGVLESLAYLGQSFFVVKPEAVHTLIDYLKNEQNFDYLVDVTAVDWPKREARFDVIYVLYSFVRNERIRIKTMLKDGEPVSSVVDLHLTADWLEREAFDMFGIEFAGHPALKRILMPDEWNGHPLRKDYGILQMDHRWVQENLGIESGQ